MIMAVRVSIGLLAIVFVATASGAEKNKAATARRVVDDVFNIVHVYDSATQSSQLGFFELWSRNAPTKSAVSLYATFAGHRLEQPPSSLQLALTIRHLQPSSLSGATIQLTADSKLLSSLPSQSTTRSVMLSLIDPTTQQPQKQQVYETVALATVPYAMYRQMARAKQLLIAFPGAELEMEPDDLSQIRAVGNALAAMLTLPEDTLVPYLRDGKYGYADQSGVLRIAPQFESASPFSASVTRVARLRPFAQNQFDLSWGFIDRAGRIIVPIHYDLVREAGGRLWAFKQLSGSAHQRDEFDQQGRRLGSAVAADLSALIRDTEPSSNADLGERGGPDRKSALVDATMPLPAGYRVTGPLSEGKAVVESNGRFGYVDERGQIVIPPQFLKAQRFSEGLAAVVLEDKVAAYIDDQGTPQLYPPDHCSAPTCSLELDPFEGGLAQIKRFESVILVADYFHPVRFWLDRRGRIYADVWE